MKKDGFSFVELLVAMVCAAILSMVAWTMMGLYWEGANVLVHDYDNEQTLLLNEIKRITKNVRSLGGRFQNRF